MPVASDGRFVGMVVGGGLEHSGGIGRVMGYTIDCWRKSEKKLPVKIYDPRGTGSILLSPFLLLYCLLAVTWGRISGKLSILHVNLAPKGSTVRKFFLVYWAEIIGVPVIIHLHGSGYHTFYGRLNKIFKNLTARMFMRSSHVIALGKNWRDFLVEEVKVPADKINIIPNGVPRPPKAAGRKKTTNSSTCRILFLGQLGTRKGTHDLLAALAKPELLSLEWHATLAGNGNVEFYVAEAEKLGLSGRINFPGWVGRSEVEELLAQADILVLPSHAENLPIAVLEGLAYGLAVVATPVGALPELLSDGIDALVVPAGAPNELESAIRRLIEEPQLRETLGVNGLKLFDDKLDIIHTATGIEALYEKILAQK